MADGYISQIKTLDNKIYLLKDSEKTDEKVAQVGNAEDKDFPIILKNTNDTTNETANVKYSNNTTTDATTTKPFTFNPSTGTLKVTQIKIGTKDDSKGLFPVLNNWNQIGASNLYWYRSFINNYYGSRSHVDNWDSGKNIGTAATASAAAVLGTVNFYNTTAAGATQTKTLLTADSTTNSNITITLPKTTGTLALKSELPTLSGLSGIGTINASGTAPLTLNGSKSGTTYTLTGSVADASASASGIVNIGAQVFAGIKTFYDHYTNGHIASTTTTAGQYAVIRCTNKGAWMTSFHVRIYTSYESYTLEISGYNYNTSNWYSPKAIMVASTATSKVTVTFGYDNDATNNYKTLWVAIPLGNYPGIDVQSVVTGHSDTQPRFSVTIQSGVPATVQTTVDAYRPWYRNETVSTAASANSVAWTNVSGRPTNVSSFTNDAGYLTSYTETDPTVPAWAKAASKPSYTASEVGALASTTKYAASGSVGGSATTVATTEDKANELIITGISSSATTTLKYNTYLTTKAGQVTIAKGTTIDNTAFNNRLILYANQNNEHASKGFTATTSSWGIGFQRKWNNATEGGVSAGIYAFGVTSWRAGLVFRVKNGTTAANAHDTNALILHDDGSATFANTVSATKFQATHTAGGQQEFRVTYGSTIDMSFMVGTANENHGIYDSKKSEWVLVAGASNTWSLNGNADTATTATNLSAAPTITSGGTATVTLSANTAYTLTVGGKSVIFKTPADANINTATAKDNILDGSNSGTEITYAPYTAQQSKLSFDTSTTAPTRTDRLNLNGFLYATKYNVAGHVTLQYNSTDSSLEFVFA